MPPIKRWFPVSHDINADADVWKARKEIGEKALSIWLEFLSIADRNEGRLPGDHDQLIRQVAFKCRSTTTKVSLVWDYGVSQVWLKCDPHARVVNYLKYHRTRVPNQAPSEPSEPSEPSSSKKKKIIDFAFQKFWEAYPKKIAKKAAIKAWKKEAGYLTDIQDQILRALEDQKKQSQWLKDNGEFIPNPATWLNGRRWEDAQLIQTSIKTKPKKNIDEPRPTDEEIERGREFLRGTVKSLVRKMGV